MRDSARLRRYSGPPSYDVLGLYRAGALAGMVCARKHGDRQWLICDLLAIDTGCVWGGALTAVRVDGGRREVVQVPCTGHQKPGA